MKKEVSRNRQMAINIASSLVVFAANILINLFLSPYIVENLGVEANGFISLANTFISYATLVTIALNSMSGRYITIAVHKDDFELANKYYTAVFIGNIVVTFLLLFPAVLCIWKLEKIIQVPANLLWDVKFLFIILFINFLINTALPNWGTATFATNNLYLQSLRSLEANILKVFLILGLFSFLIPHVYYVGIATLIISIYTAIFNWKYKNRLLPELRISLKKFEFIRVKELITSGIWNTITQTGQLLLSGMDLLIANIFIGSQEMGILALAKTVPTVIISLAGTLTGVFAPSLTIDYAKKDKESLRRSLKQGMRLTGVLLTIPLALLIIYGSEFYSLWVPSQDAKVLQILSILSCFGLIFTSGTQCLYNIFTVTNRLKTNSLLLLLSGVLSTIIVFILLQVTSLGIFAIAAVSSCINLFRNMIYTVPFCAKYLGMKWNTFFPEVISSVVSVCILTIVGYFIKSFITVDSWITLIVAMGSTGILFLVIDIFIILKKSERRYILNRVARRKVNTEESIG